MMKKNNKRNFKKSLAFNFFKKHKAIAIILVLVILGVGISFGTNFSRYAYNVIRVYYLRTQNFYFNSDKLTVEGKTYEIKPWPGIDAQSITISMNSLDNSLKGTSKDITYDVEVTCSNTNVSCSVDGDTTGRVIKGTDSGDESNKDTFVVMVTPTGTLKDDDVVSVTVLAKATSPYTQTLSATFNIVVGNYGVNYTIRDAAGQIYFDSIITNTLGEDTKVHLEWSLDDAIFDMQNTIYATCENDDDCSMTTTTVDGSTYITGIDFKVSAKSSMMVRFFKADGDNSDHSYNANNITESNETIVVYKKVE